MSDVRDVFVRVLDTTAPPVTSGETLLVGARRKARQRRWAWGASASAGALGLLVGAVLVAPTLAGRAGPDPDAGPIDAGFGAVASPTPSPTSSPAAQKVAPPGATIPMGGSAVQYVSGPEYDAAQAMLTELIALVPAGYTTPTTDTITGPDGSMRVKGVQVINWGDDRGTEYSASTEIYRDGRGASLTVKAFRGSSALSPNQDLCAQGIVHQGDDLDCHIVTAATGQPVRLSSTIRHPDGMTRSYFATVAYQEVTVQIWLTPFTMAQLPPLDPPFNDQQLADLAVNDRMVP